MTSASVAGIPVDTRHWIGGQRVASDRTFPVHSPIDGAHLADVSAGDTTAVDDAVSAANDAFPAWAALGPDGRGDLLDRLTAAISDHNDELAAVETEDNGSLLIGNTKNVIRRAAHNIKFFADYARSMEHPVIEGDAVDNHIHYDPSGVAALITPWNAPFMLSSWKIGPALAAGSTVVLKPPELAPLTCSMLGDLAAEAGIPPGVLNVVHGAGSEAGEALVAHPGVARISFTGSTATGRHIGATAGASLTPVSFELGGKSPFIVFASADLDAAARTISHQFINAGQVCLAGTRVLAHASVANDLFERVAEFTARLPLGNPRLFETRVGPLISQPQYNKVDGFVQRALDGGARAMIGGGGADFGPLYYQPTILDRVSNEDEVVQKEVFGPVLTWQTFESDEEAIAKANSTDYGLAAMVYSRSRSQAEAVSEALVAGTVWVNCFFVRDLAAPFGGSKTSGVGREGGIWSFDFFADIKNIAIRRGTFAGEETE